MPVFRISFDRVTNSNEKNTQIGCTIPLFRSFFPSFFTILLLEQQNGITGLVAVEIVEPIAYYEYSSVWLSDPICLAEIKMRERL